jgi:hypothetical protein
MGERRGSASVDDITAEWTEQLVADDFVIIGPAVDDRFAVAFRAKEGGVALLRFRAGDGKGKATQQVVIDIFEQRGAVARYDGPDLEAAAAALFSVWEDMEAWDALAAPAVSTALN